MLECTRRFWWTYNRQDKKIIIQLQLAHDPASGINSCGTKERLQHCDSTYCGNDSRPFVVTGQVSQFWWHRRS